MRAAGFYWNFKHEIHATWSWQAGAHHGWFPHNLSDLPGPYLNVCKTENEGKQFHFGAGSDLPWYNSLPSNRPSSPVVLLLGLALAALIGSAVMLKMVLNLLERSARLRKSAALPPSPASLELPPRLLTLARKTQGRKPDGLGVLGLKQRLSSRQLTQLAFPLMSREHAIAEAADEELGWQSPIQSPRMRSPIQSPLHSPGGHGSANAVVTFLERAQRAQREAAARHGATGEGSGDNAGSPGLFGLPFLPQLPEWQWSGFGSAESSADSSSADPDATLLGSGPSSGSGSILGSGGSGVGSGVGSGGSGGIGSSGPSSSSLGSGLPPSLADT